MIGFFPKPYDDELAFSWFSRYLAHSGYTSASYAALDLYENKNIRPSVELLNNLTSEAEAICTKYVTKKELIQNNTMFPEYGRFLNETRRERFLNDGDLTIGNWLNTLKVPISEEPRFLMYCPICASEDREHFGETYWHRIHQIHNIKICHKHKVYLQKSPIEINRSLTRLRPADIYIKRNSECEECNEEVIIKLADYMAEVFMNDQYGSDSVGSLLNGLLNERYMHSNGDRKMDVLYSDYKQYYEGSDNIMTIDYMAKILRGKAGSYYYICQLGLFENVTVKALLSYQPADDFDSAIYRKVAKDTGEPLDLVEKIGSAVITEYRNTGGKMIRSVRNCDSIRRDDIRLLERVKSICEEIYGKEGKRPKKVNVTAVSSALHVDHHRLKRMQGCMTEIKKYHESQEHYWAREIIWAVGQIVKNDEPLNFSHISKYTNLRRENIASCLGELEQLDSDIYDAVYEVMR